MLSVIHLECRQAVPCMLVALGTNSEKVQGARHDEKSRGRLLDGLDNFRVYTKSVNIVLHKLPFTSRQGPARCSKKWEPHNIAQCFLPTGRFVRSLRYKLRRSAVRAA